MKTPTATDERKGKAALLFRTTHLKPEEIAKQVGATAQQVRNWTRQGGWEKDFTQITAQKVRRNMATGKKRSEVELEDFDEEKLTDERADQISDSMESAFQNAARAIIRASDLIDDADNGSKLKAVVEANQKAVTTLREIADLDKSDGNDIAVEKMIASLAEDFEEGLHLAEKGYSQSEASNLH